MTYPPPASDLRGRLAAKCVYLIVTEAACRGPWERAVERALASCMVGAVQLREKSVDDREFSRRAAKLRKLADAAGALLVLNDRSHLVDSTGADGVHVGEHDASVEQARADVGPSRLVGVSTHDAREVVAAASRGADYVGLGPCFATTTKQLARAPGGPALVEACEGRTTIPIFAIGGITPGNIGSLAEAGVRRVAVGAGVLSADDPGQAAEHIEEAIDDISWGRSPSPPAVPAFGRAIATKDYRDRPGAYAILHDAEGRFGLVMTPKGLFLAGGGIDAAETAEEALRREVREELGRGVRILRPLGRAIQYTETDAGDGVAKDCTFFEAVLTGPDARPIEPDHELVWRTRDAALAELAHGSQAFAIHLLRL